MNKDYKKIAETTLKILDKKSWHNITLKEIKTKSKVKKFNLLIKNKKDLLIKLNNYFDYKVSSKISNIENSNYKDMIFEVIMMRFDVLQENRKGIISIFNSFKNRPKLLFFLLPELLDSMEMSYSRFNNYPICSVRLLIQIIKAINFDVKTIDDIAKLTFDRDFLKDPAIQNKIIAFIVLYLL